MSAVDQNLAGTASGINNAVARVASVLSIAILGVVMVSAFTSSLDRALQRQALPPGILVYIQSSAHKLAGLDLPSGLDSNTIAAIRESIAHAFVSGFRIEMIICAVLSFASAAAAWLLIPARAE